MTNNVSSAITIRQMVAFVQNKLKDYSDLAEERLTLIAIRLWQRMNMLHMPSTVEVVYLTPNEANIVNLPSDYVDYVLVGMEINGKIVTLSINERLISSRPPVCGEDVSSAFGTNSTALAQIPFIPHFYQGIYRPALYGIGGGFNRAYYKIDRAKGIIKIEGSLPKNELILQYVSSGISANTIIPLHASFALEKGILYENMTEDPRIGAGRLEMKKREYDEAVMEMRDIELIPTLTEILDDFYVSLKQTTKR